MSRGGDGGVSRGVSGGGAEESVGVGGVGGRRCWG